MASRSFESIVDLFEKSAKSFANRELFGVKKNGTWSFNTYGETKKLVDQARGGLAALGVGKGDLVSIISNNRIEWAVLAYATYGLGAAFVPMYEAQHEEEWSFIVSDCQAKIVIAATKALFDKVKDFPNKIDSVKHVICLEGDESDEHSYAHLLKLGREKPVETTFPTSSDVSNFIYTSGTTGAPKGVILTHGNIASNVTAIQDFIPVRDDDRSLSFLPWAHSFGHTGELHILVSMGASIALNTTTDKLIAELAEVKPTLLFSVPRIFNRIYAGVNKQLEERPPFLRQWAKDALKTANKRRDGKPVSVLESIKFALVDKVVFTKVRARFGGRLRFAFSGGAALSRDVADFIDGLGIVVYEGYGLTETSPIATVNAPGRRKVGSVGKPIPGVTIEIDKKATNDDKQGEIIVKGPNIMKGYHNRPEENAAVLREDGAFRTGDMGYLDDDGFLWITGRIKEQYKLENGKYVVPSPLEEELKLSPFVLNVMIYGDNKPFNVAIVVPDKEKVEKLAKEVGATGSYEEMLENDAVKKRVGEELEKASAHFRSFDKVKKFALIPEDFTQENDMLTPSLKLKRRNVLKKYGEKIEKLYVK